MKKWRFRGTEKNLEQGIAVRWNSLYTMFKVFVENKKAIKDCYDGHDFRKIELGWLECELLEECVSSLEGFYAATMLIQRAGASISVVIPVIRAITRDLERKQIEGIGNFRFISSLLSAIKDRFSSILTKKQAHIYVSF